MGQWLRLDFVNFRSVRALGLDFTSLGLLLWMIERSWEDGSLPDDPAAIQQACRGRIDESSFRGAWSCVRPLWDVDAAGDLRLAWLEEERAWVGNRMKLAAERQKTHRRGSKEAVTRDSRVSHEHVTPDRTGQDKTEQEKTTQKRAPRAAASPPWVAFLPERDMEVWDLACAEWAKARRENKHKALGATGWKAILKEWTPQGLKAFQEAVAHSAASGWQSINPKPNSGGTIDRGPSRGQTDAREFLFNKQPQPAPIRDVDATVIP